MLEIAAGQLDFWYLDGNADFALSAAEKTAFESVLSVAEAQRYQRLQVAAKRDQLLLGKYFIRQVLSRYRDVDPLDWEFVENAYGKPTLAPQFQQPLSFNLSHSRNLYVLAVSTENKVGVDVELATRARRIRELAARHFSTDEINALQQLSGSEQLAHFYQIWTLKEAYVKAKGLGLTEPLQGFTLTIEDDSRIRFVRGQCSAENESAGHSVGGNVGEGLGESVGESEPEDTWHFWTFALQRMSAGESYTMSAATMSASAATQLRHREFLSAAEPTEQAVTLVATSSPD